MSQFSEDIAFADKHKYRILSNSQIKELLQGKTYRIVSVRWKGKKYTSFTLETESCSVPGSRKNGWMKTDNNDYLLYCFEQADNSIKVYIIPFKKLKMWFWDNFTNYKEITTEQENRTKSRLIYINHVKEFVNSKELIIESPNQKTLF